MTTAQQKDAYYLTVCCPDDGIQDRQIGYLQDNSIPFTPMPKQQNRIKFSSKSEIQQFLAQIQIDIQSERIRVERQIANIEQEHQQKLKQAQEEIDKERET